MIKLIKPYITFDEVQTEFREVFESGWFTKGKYVDEFREEIKKYTGAKHAYLATSATTALTMCLKLLNIKEGDEVIVSDFSFPATANVVEDVGAKTVFADVDKTTFNMIPEQLEKKITKNTRAVIFVDALGNPSGIHKIKEICQKHNIPLIEDAACAIGSSENGILCGNIADLTCFSFHPRKLLTTGEGGAITTNNAAYAKMLDVKMNHGSVVIDGKFDFVDVGFNYRLPELQAVMGIKQLRKLNQIVKERNAIKNLYVDFLTPLGFKPQGVANNVVHNIQSLVFVVPDKVDRDGLIAKLKSNGIEAVLGTYCMSGCTYYKNKYNDVQPNSKFLNDNTITLPCYDGLDFVAIKEGMLRSL